jgi:methylase of polypeptide subunit release factors
MTTASRTPVGAAARAGLARLLARLEDAGYAFVAPTPATHALVAARLSRARPGNLRDMFGWGRAFTASDLDPVLIDDLTAAGGLRREEDRLYSRYRVSTLDGRLHLHSARASESQAVFLGPDSYRFVRFVTDALGERPWNRAVDLGAGAGAGALALSARRGQGEVVAIDVNPAALRCLEANAAHAGLPVTPVLGDGLAGTTGSFDLVIANPPYIAGRGGRTYRDGGGLYGAELALSWVGQALRRLSPGGRMLLYTGAPVVEGRDLVRAALIDLAAGAGAALGYEEIDPDVFGSSLRAPAYAEVERIAAVGAVLTREACEREPAPTPRQPA